jgi:mono/diheme cytochrome c family protein
MNRIALLFAAAALGCSTHVPIRFGTHQTHTPIVALSNPSLSEGDPIAGRQTFIAMQCIDCHRVAGDPALPAGRRSIAGPVLRGLDRHPAKEVASRITSRTTGVGEELFGRTMKDYAQPMTARQLVDVVAYLRHPRIEEP